MKQDIRSGNVDILTQNELGKSLHEAMSSHLDQYWRDLYRGVKLLKLPMVRLAATGTSLVLAAPVGSNAPGPDSGYIWQILRVLVQSNGAADAATVSLFGGSDPSANPASLIDSVNVKLGAGYVPGKSVYLFPGEQLYAVIGTATAANVYTMTGVACEVPAERIGELLL